MNKASHILIAKQILNQYFPHATFLDRKVLMLGCVHPDKNPFTYFRGSFRHRLLRGHNWENARPLIRRLCVRMEQEDSRLYRVYCLGLLLHYCCDGFTYAHNRAFAQNLRAHRCYEMQLHRVLKKAPVEFSAFQKEGSLWETVEKLHSRYEQQPYGTQSDQQHICKVVSILVESYSAKDASSKIPKNSGEICPICTCKTETMVLY